MSKFDLLPDGLDVLPPEKRPLEGVRTATEIPPELVSSLGERILSAGAVKDSGAPEDEWDHGGCPT